MEHNKNELTSDIVLEKKSGHKDSVVTSCLYNGESDTKFFTGSADQSVRLWDLRVGGSVKMFSSPRIEDEVTSIEFSERDGLVYCSSLNSVSATLANYRFRYTALMSGTARSSARRRRMGTPILTMMTRYRKYALIKEMGIYFLLMIRNILFMTLFQVGPFL